MNSIKNDQAKYAILPWITVGVVTIIAIALSTILIKIGEAGHTREQETAAQQKESAQENVPPTVHVPKLKTPQVNPGSTYAFSITQWGVTVDLSAKFGSARYELKDGVAILSSDLINSLPQECAPLREQFGFKREGSKLTALKPAAQCEVALEVYNEIWGLLEAAVTTQRVE
ncbi:hypothetical protein KJY77_03250 [Canibacter sp. lx-72]|uniref:hypothetical protein n=1 Tax=Canibacter zhuwentaonis TaxID=2837491 RepID=UPI001BDCF8B0|nr:hypothetical protein [Canibacter zhuwentaonis]MBT1018154.1 hypothetical protein [Canibacter zhuwentaonis]MBT1035165.1 hypothetical protein [Canibacter zhuwentaonis]